MNDTIIELAANQRNQAGQYIACTELLLILQGSQNRVEDGKETLYHHYDDNYNVAVKEKYSSYDLKLNQ